MISSVISNTIMIYQKQKYEKFYSYDLKEMEILATVVSNKEEKEYKYVYTIKVEKLNMKYNLNDANNKNVKDTYLYIYTEKNEKYNLEYGDKIIINGSYEKPEIQRNYKGFDYSEYLKLKKVYGSIDVTSVSVVSKKSYNKFLQIANDCSLKIKENIEKNYSSDTKGILLGLTLGDTQDLDDEVKQDFRDSSISHVLAISGMHIGFIILGLMIILKRPIGKRLANIVICIILIFYMFITGFSPSVVRATIMGILVLMASTFYRKNDVWTSLSISLLIILIFNPFLLESVGLQLSFMGTIGIVLFNKTVDDILQKIKMPKFIREILAVTISAQMCILPIMVINFNTIGISFLITNVLVSIIIGPIVLLGFFQIILFFLNDFLALFAQKILEPMIQLLLLISRLGANLPYSKIYVGTPSIIVVIFYYFILLVLNQIYKAFSSKNKSVTQIRIKNLINLAKYKFNQNKKKIVAVVLAICLVFGCIKIAPNNLKIFFIDVGQGDACLIETPLGKKILVDGGGNIFDKYLVGKNTLLPYLLDRNVVSLDYVFISHFDTDHVRWHYLFDARNKNKKYCNWQAV
jgi:competence protein ComEC